MSCISATQLKFWSQTDLGRKNSASYWRQGRQILLTLLTMITRWSRSSVQFYAVIAQNLTGEFIRKIYAASWILFTLTGVWKSRKPESGIGTGMGTETWGPFLERPGNFSGPKANFKFKTCWIAAQFLGHKPVNFASFTDSFIVLLSKLLKLWSWM